MDSWWLSFVRRSVVQSLMLGMIHSCVGWFCCQAESDGIVHRYCPSHLEDSELKPNVTCAVYNHDGTGITTLMLLSVTYYYYYY